MTKKEHLDRILEVELLTLATGTVEFLLESCPDQVEDIENLFTYECPHCGEDISRLAHTATEAHEDEGHCYTCPECHEGFTDPVEGQQEVMQWWIVSDWLAERLTEMGEVTWAPHDVTYWGRGGCGYSLKDESCFVELAARLAARGKAA